MNYLTLRKKPTIILKSDVEGNTEVQCLDLLARQNKGVNLENFDTCTVTEYYVGRPDLISFAFYGTDVYGDVICKANGISNPFEINEGDFLIIPSLYRAQEYVTDMIQAEESKLIGSDKDDITYDKLDMYKKLRNESRAPNELTVGQTNYIIDRTNKIIFY